MKYLVYADCLFLDTKVQSQRDHSLYKNYEIRNLHFTFVSMANPQIKSLQELTAASTLRQTAKRPSCKIQYSLQLLKNQYIA